METLNKFVICKKQEKEVSTTAGGITIPEKASDFVSAEIVRVGKDVDNPVSIVVGMKETGLSTSFPANSKIYRTEGQEYFVVKEEDIVEVK